MDQAADTATYEARWNTQHLDDMRRTGDALADDTVSAIFMRGDRDLVNRILRSLEEQDAMPTDAPPELQRYLDESACLPNWADEAALTRAYAFLAVHGVRYNIVLLYLSLPIMNAWRVGGAQTLAMTGELSKTFARRLSETLRFVCAVIEDKSLSPGGRGVCTTQKIRLMHATIRHFAKGARCPGGAGYFESDWGEPINQEALSATMLAFSTLAMDGIRRLSGDVSDQNESDMLHLWCVIGYILGIRQDSMPETLAEARWLWQEFRTRNFGHSAAGVMLTRAHIDFMRQLAEGDPFLTKTLKYTDEGLMRLLMGKDVAVNMLGVPDTLWTEVSAGVAELLVSVFGHTVDHDTWVQHWVETHANALLGALQAIWNKEADNTHEPPRPFHVPCDDEAKGGLRAACELAAGDIRGS